MENVKTITKENLTLTISYDDCAESSREWDNLGTMICEHNRYSLGDNHDLDFSECASWEDHEKVIKEEFGRDCIMLPLYLYDHSAITMNTTGFSCNWDSGRVGTIVVSRDKVRKEFNKKRVSPKLKNQILKILESEVETYDQYLTGEVFSYSIENENGEVIDSCCGFYGEDYAIQEGKSMLEFYIKNQNQNQKAA